MSEKSDYRLDPELIKENLDENTIGVFVILGSTYTGHYEPVEEISNILDAFEKETGNDIPIHVDGASGRPPFQDNKFALNAVVADPNHDRCLHCTFHSRRRGQGQEMGL